MALCIIDFIGANGLRGPLGGGGPGQDNPGLINGNERSPLTSIFTPSFSKLGRTLFRVRTTVSMLSVVLGAVYIESRPLPAVRDLGHDSWFCIFTI
jgi:hypothetical protein